MEIIIEKILEIDKELILISQDSPEINIKEVDWKNKLKKRAQEENNKKIDIIEPLQEELLDSFLNLKINERIAIWNAISNTEKFRFDFIMSKRNYNFKKELLLEIIMNLEPDYRDAMLRLNSLIKNCDKKKINIIEELIPFSDKRKNGNDKSMSDLLKLIIKNN
ncbi:hypothetical protein [Aureivirga marina]|uniref:hypothetical protein n=1 Tax=Aureivirga marina TaxID=1182451 RepID=UPI0018CB7A24|nr:hypothetical protein [Aureivirga marina]